MKDHESKRKAGSVILSIRNKRRVRICIGCIILCVSLFGNAGEYALAADNTAKDKEELWKRAEHSAFGAYPETVTYTLGKISGSKNSNLPVGDTYENNAYTRYLKKMLNIQNQDIFELEDGSTYE